MRTFLDMKLSRSTIRKRGQAGPLRGTPACWGWVLLTPSITQKRPAGVQLPSGQWRTQCHSPAATPSLLASRRAVNYDRDPGLSWLTVLVQHLVRKAITVDIRTLLGQ